MKVCVRVDSSALLSPSMQTSGVQPDKGASVLQRVSCVECMGTTSQLSRPGSQAIGRDTGLCAAGTNLGTNLRSFHL